MLLLWIRNGGIRPLPALLAVLACFARAQVPPPGPQRAIPPLFEQAMRAQKAGDLERASRLYDRIVELDPSSAEMWANRGIILYQRERFREAVESCAKAVSLKPGLVAPNLYAGKASLRMRRPQEAARFLDRALRLDPANVEAKVERANAAAALGDFERAVALYRGILAGRPGAADTWHRLAVAYLGWGTQASAGLMESRASAPYAKLLLAERYGVFADYQKAQDVYRELVSLVPDSVDFRRRLAEFYLNLPGDRTQAAAEEIRRLRDLAPRDLGVLWLECRLEARRAGYPAAGECIERVASVDSEFALRQLPDLGLKLTPEQARQIADWAGANPQGMGARALLAAAYVCLKDEEHGSASLRAFQEALPRLPAVAGSFVSYSQTLARLEAAAKSRALNSAELALLADAAIALHDYERAAPALRLLLRQPDADGHARFRFSTICRGLAKESLRSLLAVEPDSYQAHLLLAQMAADSGDNALARVEYEKALARDTSDPVAHLHYIRVLSALRDFTAARAAVQSALVRFPAQAGLHSEMGSLLLLEGDGRAAARSFEKALALDPSLIRARTGLADALAAQGDLRRAIQEMNKALASDRDGSLHYRLGRWYRDVGQEALAESAFAEAAKRKEGGPPQSR